MNHVTREMISAAHNVTMEHGDIVLSYRLLERIYLSMDAMANRAETSGSPLPDERLDQILAEHVTVTDPNLRGAIYMAMRDLEAAHGIVERPCTCHPDDSPPTPCARQYAVTECRAESPAQSVDSPAPSN